MQMTAEKDPADTYFCWLYDQVNETRNMESTQSYSTICDMMHRMKFRVIVKLDDNRVGDAADLRNTFNREAGVFSPLEEADLLFADASIFEVLVALAMRADRIVSITQYKWFMIFIENLGLEKWNDNYCLIHSTWPAQRILNKLNNRTYRRDGHGGLFPLRNPAHDQREVEIWYQMGAWINQNGMY